MRRFPVIAIALLCTAGLTARSDSPQAPGGGKTASVQLVYNSDTRGYFRPCG